MAQISIEEAARQLMSAINNFFAATSQARNAAEIENFRAGLNAACIRVMALYSVEGGDLPMLAANLVNAVRYREDILANAESSDLQCDFADRKMWEFFDKLSNYLSARG